MLMVHPIAIAPNGCSYDAALSPLQFARPNNHGRIRPMAGVVSELTLDTKHNFTEATRALWNSEHAMRVMEKPNQQSINRLTVPLLQDKDSQKGQWF